MGSLSRFRRGIVRITLTAFVATSLYVPTSQASMVSTSTVVSHAQADAERTQLSAVLARADVRARMQALGVDPAKAQERVAAMSDQEVSQLYGKFESAPAGGHGYDIFNYALDILLLLIITDLLGITNFFGFHKQKTDNPAQ